jgi:acyl-CoA dehydrogenase
MTEPGTGSDLKSVKTTAELVGNEYVLNGSKIFITNGQTADLIIVVAKTDKTMGTKGVSLLVLETEGADGLHAGAEPQKTRLQGQRHIRTVF